MTLLHTSFASGDRLTPGSDYGNIGISGLNEITHRLNTIMLTGSNINCDTVEADDTMLTVDLSCITISG